MGEFRFRVPEFWNFEARHARTVHVVGLDGVPRPCNIQLEQDCVVIRRNQNESGRTYVSFPFRSRGELMICTGTLPESSDVYDFTIELARGTINRLRNQTSIWQEGGLQISERVQQLTRLATEMLVSAITGPEQAATDKARDALDQAIEAIFELGTQFGQEISAFRVSESEIPSFWMATRFSPGSTVLAEKNGFDFTAITIDEALVNKSGFGVPRLIVGPVLDASPMSTFSVDNESFDVGRQKLLNQCDVLLDDLPTGTTLIHVASNLNGIGHKNLSYRQQIQLTTELISRFDDSTHEIPVMVSFDYPWAERLAWSVGGIHPLQIADDIMRNGCRISFIGLDINLDYWPCGSVSRDPFQWIDIIDLWSQLGLPLVLCLRFPQPSTKNESVELIGATEYRSTHEENVTIAIESDDEVEESESHQKVVGGNTIRENQTHAQRLKLLEVLLPMLVARPGVHGVFWRQWNDGQDPRFPHAGLLDDDGMAKPTMQLIEQLRTKVLKR